MPEERALGVAWEVENDVLKFNVRFEEKPSTRRGILSTVASLFDPLGLVAPALLDAKLLLQDLCKDKKGWDDPISETQKQNWEKWKKSMGNIPDFKIPRSFSVSLSGPVKTVEMHVFSDASEVGYGACVYVKFFDEDGNISVSLVLGKSRLVPLKRQTLPRLELMAAVLGSQLGMCVKKELDFKIDKTTYYTDSMIVYSYIKNETRRFKTFVANRLAIIHENTDAKDWRHIKGQDNPADIASRGLANDLNTWINGPAFLLNDNSTDQDQIEETHNYQDDPEVKKEPTVAVVTQIDATEKLINHYSDWKKIKATIAWFLRFKDFLRNKANKNCEVKTGVLTIQELEKAEVEVCKFVQASEFKSEMTSLKNNQAVQRASALKGLDHVLRNGLLCVGGRLQHSDLNDNTKHPIILPKNHDVTCAIIRHFHALNGHMGVNHVLSQIRCRFWILKGRAAIRKVINKCVVCSRVQKPTLSQKMAPLLEEQTESGKPAFTYVGVDFFGPFKVKVKRSTEKRYGCLFTCLCTRAVHVEITHSLDTNSFLNALSRFMARRGKPLKMWSDQGGSFIAGAREINEEIDAWNKKEFNRKMTQSGIEWNFNSPHSSYKGGAFERMIRTFRKVLNSTVNLSLLTDEQLLTVMAEAEKIINDRPLTYIGDDVTSLDVLTPSKLLLLRSNSCMPAGDFCMNKHNLVRTWKECQAFADKFWSQWLKEYLPTLQVRQTFQRSKENIRIDDVVLVNMPNQPRGHWPMGRVTSVQEGRDGLVRSVIIQTQSNMLVRSPKDIIRLELAP